MDILELARKRFSCRKFDKEKPVSREDIEYCIEAARVAPSACNAQPYKFTVCSGDKAKEVAGCLGVNKFAAGASHLVVISEENYNMSAAIGSKVKDQDYRSIDIGIVAAHMTLAAADKGLSTCIIGWFEEKKLKALLGIKNRIRLVIAIGYPSEDCAIREKKRKAMDEIAEFK